MNPDAVSEALYECEIAIEECTEYFSSHLADCNMKNRTWTATLVSSFICFHKCHILSISVGEKTGGACQLSRTYTHLSSTNKWYATSHLIFWKMEPDLKKRGI